MKIEKDSVVSIHYTLTNDDQETIDSSAGGTPLVYLHGAKNIISGLEEALEGKSAGDKFQVKIAPEKAYGPYLKELVQSLSKEQFGENEVQVGMQFQAFSQQGPIVLTVIGLDGDDVMVDANHPLAGENLTFDVEVMEVRSSTEEERAHGHVHGPGGHQHN